MTQDMIDKHVVIRSSQSGVWLGILVATDGSRVRLRDARRAWSWEGAASCSGLAGAGPSGGNICHPVAVAVIDGVCEILLASADAVARWGKVKPWSV